MSRIIGNDELSEKMIQKTIDDFCYNLDSLTKTKRIGSGAQGVVYEWCLSTSDCDYVIKINKIDPEKITKMDFRSEDEQNTTNTLSQYNLAPKIYAMRYCSKESVLITLMDKIKGYTVASYLSAKRFSVSDMAVLIEYIGKIHKLGLYHGDLNPANIFYTKADKKVQFIDITYRRVWRTYYDYLTIMYYFIFFFKDNQSIEKYSNFLSLLITAVESEMAVLAISRDSCVDYIKKIINRLERTDDVEKYTESLQELSNVVKNVIYFYSKKCIIVTQN